MSLAQQAEFDPCYFAVGHFEEVNYSVGVLPTIREDYAEVMQEVAVFPHLWRESSHDVAVQASNRMWEWGEALEEAEAEFSGGDDEVDSSVREVGVQTDPIVDLIYDNGVRWGKWWRNGPYPGR